MESQRNFIIIGLAVVSYFLFVAWQQDYAPVQQPKAEQQKETEQQSNVDDFPSDVSAYSPEEQDNTNKQLPQEIVNEKITEAITSQLIDVETMF